MVASDASSKAMPPLQSTNSTQSRASAKHYMLAVTKLGSRTRVLCVTRQAPFYRQQLALVRGIGVLEVEKETILKKEMGF
jgi:hypothetical protein